MAVSGNTLYVGGLFQLIGHTTSAGVPVDATTGQIEAGFPDVNGVVHSVARDGAGGWFIGGEFDRVGNDARNHLAHIRSDLTVSPWNPDADGAVYAVAVDAGVVYVGGAFTATGGSSRSHLAAIDGSTGMTLAWNPSADQSVRALLVEDGVIHAGGDFTQCGGQTRNGLVAIDAAGAILPWNPNVTGSVRCLDAADGVLYVGGLFAKASNVTRLNLAAYDLASGGLTPWNGTANGAVNAIAAHGGKVYVGGDFSTVAGQSRSGLAALSTRWWQALPWSASTNGPVHSIVATGNHVYVGGDFFLIGDQTRVRAAVLDTATAQVGAWDPRAGGAVRSMAFSGSRAYLGGSFSFVGGDLRRNAAAIDRTTETVTAWNPDVGGTSIASVHEIVPSGGSVYLGGLFFTAGGQPRRHIAQVDGATGLALPWTIGTTIGVVDGLEVQDDQIFVGTSDVGNQIRAVDRATGAIRWIQRVSAASGWVYALRWVQNQLCVAGHFDSAGTDRSRGLALLDPGNGAVTVRFPSTQNQYNAVCEAPGSFLAGGSVLSGFDSETGDVTWPGPTEPMGGIFAMTAADGIVFVSGGFTSFGGQVARYVVALDGTSFSPLEWSPGAITAGVGAIASTDGIVYLGGDFEDMDGIRHPNLAAVDGPSVPLSVPPLRPESLRSPSLSLSPNPVGRDGIIHLTMPAAGRVSIDLLDVTGRRVREIRAGQITPAGSHEIEWKRNGLEAGVYWLRMTIDGTPKHSRIVVLP